MKNTLLLSALLIFFTVTAAVQAADSIKLPEPSFKSADASLFQALKGRCSQRAFSDKALSQEQISDILWAAYGVNRPGDKRTIAAALGKYTVSIYVLTADGAFRHDRTANTLVKVTDKDLRKSAEGRGTLGPAAGAVFLLTADGSAFKSMPAEQVNLFIGYEAGSICQDIYLYCSAAGLNTLCCGSLDRKTLASQLKLPAGSSPILTMIVGYPPAR
ncbi:MAG: nitroreductase family protein [Victivallales bacterium]|nr:nitroreductase family protein [Victivallales bacterium]